MCHNDGAPSDDIIGGHKSRFVRHYRRCDIMTHCALSGKTTLIL